MSETKALGRRQEIRRGSLAVSTWEIGWKYDDAISVVRDDKSADGALRSAVADDIAFEMS